MRTISNDWRCSPVADAALRILGLALFGVAAAASLHLHATRMAWADSPSPINFLLATVAFLGGSAGAGLLAFGGGVFGRCQISARWARMAEARRNMR